ncbi:MAG: hypothetical protein U0736_12535 [Gemmataceae bacterium]
MPTTVLVSGIGCLLGGILFAVQRQCASWVLVRPIYTRLAFCRDRRRMQAAAELTRPPQE